MSFPVKLHNSLFTSCMPTIPALQAVRCMQVCISWLVSFPHSELDIIVPRFEGRGYLTYGPLFMDNTVFRVNFRTAQPNGMILYNAQLHDGSGGDFIQLSIVNGFLDFRFDLGSGISPVQSTVKVDDGEWHEVQIR